MTHVLLIIIVVTGILIAIFIIPLLLEARRTVQTLRKTTEEKLNPALDELQITLRSLRSVSNTVNDITTDVKTLSKSIADVGSSISTATALVNNLSTAAAVKVISLRAGIMAAFTYLATHFLKKGDQK